MAAKKKSVAKKPAARKAAAKKTTKKSVKKPAAKKPAAKKPAAKKSAAQKTVKKAPARATPELVVLPETGTAATTIVARYDAGFGNALFLRGSGAGLSWDRGAVMECRGADEWCYESSTITEPIEVKVLINDATWSTGENAVVRPGDTVVLAPSFE